MTELEETLTAPRTLDELERSEAAEVAAKAVGATLSMLAESSLDHEDLPMVLHMLSRVLDRPEELT